MSHYAEIDDTGTVVNVIRADKSYIHSGAVGDPRNWIQTSYNTHGGEHPEGKPLRKNYAGVGYTYDAELDAFIPPKPTPNSILNPNTGLWTVK